MERFAFLVHELLVCRVHTELATYYSSVKLSTSASVPSSLLCRNDASPDQSVFVPR